MLTKISGIRIIELGAKLAETEAKLIEANKGFTMRRIGERVRLRATIKGLKRAILREAKNMNKRKVQ